jgi:hypothetical protein
VARKTVGGSLEENRRRDEVDGSPKRKLRILDIFNPHLSGTALKEAMSANPRKVEVETLVAFEPRDIRGIAKIGRVKNVLYMDESNSCFVVQELKKNGDFFNLSHTTRRVYVDNEFICAFLKFRTDSDHSSPMLRYRFGVINNSVFA